MGFGQAPVSPFKGRCHTQVTERWSLHKGLDVIYLLMVTFYIMFGYLFLPLNVYHTTVFGCSLVLDYILYPMTTRSLLDKSFRTVTDVKSYDFKQVETLSPWVLPISMMSNPPDTNKFSAIRGKTR